MTEDDEKFVDEVADLVGDIAVALTEFGWTVTANWPGGARADSIKIAKDLTKKTWVNLTKRAFDIFN